MIRPSARAPLLTAAGLGTWAVMLSGAIFSGRVGGLPGGLAWTLFPIGFLVASTGTKERPRSRRTGLALQSAAALVATATGGGQFAGVLLAVIAGQAPMRLPIGIAGLGCLLQTAGFTVVLAQHSGPQSAAFTAVGYGAFQLFAFGAAWLAQRESAARAELARVNAELHTTQALLAERARDAERLRISRELHDALGHHLTALSLQLELARNTTGGNEAVTRAQGLAREMLAEVRGVVGTLRETQPLELRRAIQALVEGLPSPTVHLSLAETLEDIDGPTAQVAFRCVQEGLTNALRHSGAANIWIDLQRSRDAVHVTVRDDGSASNGRIVVGHGLRGLRERLISVGGALEVSARPDSGVSMAATIPIQEERPS